ncbi:hypothetical protein pneo_cds_1 [Pandoravirus neocaledonia]|uniref:Uncharacterized protein n=1 Tax=Pandoravirus neocaledonia TaxID=2107708 RepID=A0A2U7UAY3_9VIRU|nr:hypothetical protein pneo_cds_1 [Pandoravirus neocaledonia]AVK75608.1 hypothetical protein pneo_cds_1 [Pandoravirus neocaledonia]
MKRSQGKGLRRDSGVSFLSKADADTVAKKRPPGSTRLTHHHHRPTARFTSPLAIPSPFAAAADCAARHSREEEKTQKSKTTTDMTPTAMTTPTSSLLRQKGLRFQHNEPG